MLAKGRLNRRVQIESAGVPTYDNNNEPIAGAPSIKTRYAEVKPAPGTERFANAENAATAPTRFIFRYEKDLVDVQKVLIYEGRRYQILSAIEYGNREGWEVLGIARAEVPNG